MDEALAERNHLRRPRSKLGAGAGLLHTCITGRPGLDPWGWTVRRKDRSRVCNGTVVLMAPGSTVKGPENQSENRTSGLGRVRVHQCITMGPL